MSSISPWIWGFMASEGQTLFYTALIYAYLTTAFRCKVNAKAIPASSYV